MDVLPTSINLHLSTCISQTTSLNLHLSNYISQPGSLNLHLSKCMSQPACLNLHVSTCISQSGSLKLHISNYNTSLNSPTATTIAFGYTRLDTKCLYSRHVYILLVHVCQSYLISTYIYIEHKMYSAIGVVWNDSTYHSYYSCIPFHDSF